MTSLAAKGLSFRYEPEQPVLTGVSFEICSGSILGVAGANGSGKTTLISILAGLLEPDNGELWFDTYQGQKASELLRIEAALIPQNVDHWLLGETAIEDLTLGLDCKQDVVNAVLADISSHWDLESLFGSTC